MEILSNDVGELYFGERAAVTHLWIHGNDNYRTALTDSIKRNKGRWCTSWLFPAIHRAYFETRPIQSELFIWNMPCRGYWY